MALRGNLLNQAIEAELILMVKEGYSQSPITASNLHARLISKSIITGKLSTLSTPERRELIANYADQQHTEVGGVLAKSLKSGSKNSKAKIIARNAQLTERVKEAEEQLAMNTKSLISIVKAVKNSGTVANVERYLSPSLIRELSND